MSSREIHTDITHRAVVETAQRFHFRAETDDGRLIEAPFSYQIEEPGFRPYRAGKASPEEVQGQLDQLIDRAETSGVTLGIEDTESLTKLAIQMGWGTDCSNLAAHTLETIHDWLLLPSYFDNVYRSAKEVQKLHEAATLNGTLSWTAKDSDGEPRKLNVQERNFLEDSTIVPISWIVEVFGKDPTFVTGSAHICAPEATVEVDAYELLPGDLVSFVKAGAGIVSHVGVVEQAEVIDGEMHADFWHSWHSRDFESGVRRDKVIVDPNGDHRWSHEGLEDPVRYEAYAFRRPAAMAIAYSRLAA